jgi:hypothetical protein
VGLAATVASAVAAAFSAVGDLAESVTYTSITTADYNLTTGDIAGQVDVYEGIPVVVSSYNQVEVGASGGMIKASDRRLLVRAASLACTPKPSDEVTRADGSVWRVESLSGDPANATWDMQTRRLDG